MNMVMILGFLIQVLKNCAILPPSLKTQGLLGSPPPPCCTACGMMITDWSRGLGNSFGCCATSRKAGRPVSVCSMIAGGSCSPFSTGSCSPNFDQGDVATTASLHCFLFVRCRPPAVDVVQVAVDERADAGPEARHRREGGDHHPEDVRESRHQVYTCGHQVSLGTPWVQVCGHQVSWGTQWVQVCGHQVSLSTPWVQVCGHQVSQGTQWVQVCGHQVSLGTPWVQVYGHQVSLDTPWVQVYGHQVSLGIQWVQVCRSVWVLSGYMCVGQSGYSMGTGL